MKLEIDIPEHQYNNIIALKSLSLGRVPYKGIIMYAINAIKRAKPLPEGDFIAVCKSDFPLTEEVEKDLKNTAFISDDPQYCFEMTEIIYKKVQKKAEKP